MLFNESVLVDVNEEAPILNAISQRLVSARLDARPLSEYPGNLPVNLESAYRIQSLSISAWPDEISGWKVGGVPQAFQAKFGAERLSGPIFRAATRSVEEGGTISMSVFRGGFAAIEAEFIAEFAVSIAPGEIDQSAIDITDLVSTVYIGAEIASSPMAEINRLGPVAIISDFGNNAGLVIGPKIEDWRNRLAEQITIAVTVDGKLLGTIAAAMKKGVFAAVSFLIELCAERGIHIPAGTLVCCGALSGIHDVEVGALAQVNFDGLGGFGVQFTERRPAVRASPA